MENAPAADSKALPSRADDLNRLSERVIGCAIEVHRELGPGLLESVYDRAFCIELAHRGVKFLRQQTCPVIYRGVEVGHYRPDILVEGELLIELTASNGWTMSTSPRCSRT